MNKKERFAVMAKVLPLMSTEPIDVTVSSFDIYPSDEMLETVWLETTQRSMFTKVYYLHVEKQVRFE